MSAHLHAAQTSHKYCTLEKQILFDVQFFIYLFFYIHRTTSVFNSFVNLRCEIYLHMALRDTTNTNCVDIKNDASKLVFKYIQHFILNIFFFYNFLFYFFLICRRMCLIFLTKRKFDLFRTP